MNKEEIYALLDEKEITFKAFEHEAVFTVEQADALRLPDPEAGTKNLFLRDSKKRDYILLTVREDLPVNLKELRCRIGSKPLSFASPEDLKEKMDLIPGAVTPFGLLNEKERQIRFFLDDWFRGRQISAHPCDNRATVFLSGDALMDLLTEQGCRAEWIDLSGPVPGA